MGGSLVLVLACSMAWSACVSAGDSGAEPPARAHHALVFDAGQGAVYLIGGSTRDGAAYRYFADVWRWTGTAWRPDNPLPFPRASHRVAYGSRELLLFGGQFDAAVRAEGVVWARRDDRWAAVGGHRAAGRDDPGVCFDRGRARLVVFGGWDREARYRNETWEWDGSELRRIEVTVSPSPRAGMGFAWHPGQGACVLFGGRGESGYRADTWAWDGSRWIESEGLGPSPRWFPGFTTHGPDIVMFGGRGPEGDLADTWILSVDGWRRFGGSAGPSARGLAAIASTGTSVLLFGGRSSAGDGFTDLGDTWEFVSGWRRLR